MRSSRLIGSLVVVAGTLTAVACNREPSQPTRFTPTAVTTTSSSLQFKSLIACPTTESLSDTVQADENGGTYTVGPIEVVLPAGALTGTVPLSISVPSGDFMMVDVSAVGLDHFEFVRPISVTLDYSRCPVNELPSSPLSVWYVGDDGTMLEQMPTLDDRFNSRVTFLTGHLSGYAIAD